MRSREKDSDEEGYSKRSPLQKRGYQGLIIASMIIGPTGITGLMNAYTDPNIKLQSRIEQTETKNTAQDLEITGLTAKDREREMRVENYIKAHSEAQALRQQMTEKDYLHIMDLLNEIKDDVKHIKNDH